MFLWRISNHDTLDGRGGLIASARWHTRGRPVVYLAATPAGALVEALVHLELRPDKLPASYRLLKAEAPDDLSRMRFSALTEDWRENETASRTLGDEWLARAQTALLEVPSAVLPETMNVLLNPAHPEAARVRVVWHEAYPFDRRLFKGSGP
ncbi:MAG TPA: RES family NAD+ phosphorylase [Candidatus Sulfotelmatobacter sp.]|nr:RES family NAD+ phosphorylase [Candidatus Sulfotelmatobacter sp.]